MGDFVLGEHVEERGTVEQHRKIADAVEDKEEFEICELAKQMQLGQRGII